LCFCFSNLFQSNTSPQSLEVASFASQIFQRFLTPPTNAASLASSPSDYLSESSEDMRGIIEEQIGNQGAVNNGGFGPLTPSLFDPVRSISISILHAEFADFRRGVEFVALQDALNAAAASGGAGMGMLEDRRDVSPWDPAMTQLFIIKVKGTKRSKEHALPSLKRLQEQATSSLSGSPGGGGGGGAGGPAGAAGGAGAAAGGVIGAQGQGMTSIGRDKSNTLVIEDSRVSRSHARVEYTDTRQSQQMSSEQSSDVWRVAPNTIAPAVIVTHPPAPCLCLLIVFFVRLCCFRMRVHRSRQFLRIEAERKKRVACSFASGGCGGVGSERVDLPTTTQEEESCGELQIHRHAGHSRLHEDRIEDKRLRTRRLLRPRRPSRISPLFHCLSITVFAQQELFLFSFRWFA
jgi:hypothetical protein